MNKITFSVTSGELPADTLLTLTRPGDACTDAERTWLAVRRAYALRLLNRHREALALSDSLLSSAALSVEQRAKLHSYRANSLYYLGRYEEAIAPYDSARQYYDRTDYPYPTARAELTANLAWSYLQTGRVEAAYCLFIEARDAIYAECRQGCQNAHTREVLREVRKGIARAWEIKPDVNPLRCAGARSTEASDAFTWIACINGVILFVIVLSVWWRRRR